MKSHRLVNSLVVLAVALSTIGMTGSAASAKALAPSPFVGEWQAVDADGAALVAAAQAEGFLNVIALPRSWCNYGAVIDGFASTYGITVNELNPAAGSADELDAIRAGGPDAPDVIDVGPGFAVQAQSEALIAPYMVSTWDTIPEFIKESEGYWYGDYSGLMAIAANTAVSAAPTAWQDLLDEEGVSPTAIGGYPTVSNMAFFSVYGAALASGGSLDNIEPGVQFFRDLRDAGRLLSVIGSGDTLASGETPVLPEWSYLALAQRDANPQISAAIPEDGAIGSFYTQAISATAPHPNAARLWMEYLYSDEGQLAFAEGYCIPARFDEMNGRGAIPENLLALLPTPEEIALAQFPSVDQISAAQSYVEANWLCTVYGYGCSPAEKPRQPATKDECKDDGWRDYPHAGFRDQGDCVSFVSSGKFVCRDALGCASYEQDDPVRIATALTTSGDVEFFGVDSQRGAERALAQQGELFGHSLELRSEDDGCGPDGGAAAASLIAADPSIAAVIGTTCSSAAETAAPVISAAGLSMVSPSNTSPYLTDPATHSAGYLRAAWNDADNARTMAEFLRGQGKQSSFVIVQADNNNSVAVGQAFAAEFGSLGGENLGFEAVDESGEGLDTVLDAVGAGEAGAPDVLYFPVFDPLASAIVSGVRSRPELDETVMASNDFFYSQEFIDAHWPEVEGMFFGVADDSFTQSEAYADFRDQFSSEYGVEPLPLFSAHAFDAATMILRAIEEVSVIDGGGALHIGRQALRSALFNTEALEGLTGTITCDVYGDCGATGFKIVTGEPSPPPPMGLRVNYGHDWVESFYEAGHQVELIVTGPEGTVKATATLFTEPKGFWDGASGFQTAPDDWEGGPPDLQPLDWVYAEVDNGVSAQVQLGEIAANIDLEGDSVTGTIEADWITDVVSVECLDWGSGSGQYNKDAGAHLTNGEDTFSCTWNPETEWDLQTGQDIGVGYLGPDGHWVANAFRVTNPTFVAYLPGAVEGYDWPMGHMIELVINGEYGALAPSEQRPDFPEGVTRVLFEVWQDGFALEAGDRIVMVDEATGLRKEHLVAPLAVTDIVPAEAKVIGVSDPAYELWVWLYGQDGQVPERDGNAWTATFSELLPGAWGGATQWDEDGDGTSIDFQVPAPPEAEQWIWAYTLDAPAWAEGAHTYSFEMISDAGGGPGGEREFIVNFEAELYDDFVLLDPWSSTARIEDGCETIELVDPEQATRFRWGWLTDDPLTYDEVLALYESMQVWVAWDDGDPVEMERRDLLQADEVDWGGYVCGLTAP